MLMQPIIRPMITFGPCLKQILQKRNISASELARMMEYKSRNSIFRILDDEGGDGTRQALYDRLMEDDLLNLTRQEQLELTQALEISRVGLVAFLNNRAMRELLMDVSMEEAAAEICLIQADGRREPIDRLFEYGDELLELNVTITGCCDRQVCAKMSHSLNGLTVRTSIAHFVYTGEEEIIRNLSAIQPLLYRTDYMAYAVEPGMFSREKQRLYRNNMIYVQAKTIKGERLECAYIMVDKGCFFPIKRRSTGPLSRLNALVCKDIGQMRALKMNANADHVDYLAYTEECMKLEQSRAVYMIKRDVPISYVPSEILACCVMESAMREGIAGSQEIVQMLEQLKCVHDQRFENFFDKRKPTYTVFSLEAMERFAQTGTQSDHFFAFRPYTVQERVCILTHLREQAEHNPSFHVRFFKAEYEAPPMEIALYEGAGTLMAKPNTNYNLKGDHTETLITQESFCQCYKTYFLKDLMKRQVMDRQHTLQALDCLIEMAKRA